MEKNLLETIKEALENNQLENQMSVIRMEAVRQQISDEELEKLVEQAKQALDLQRKQEESHAREMEIQQKAVASAIKHRYILWGICIAAIILEWLLIFNAHPAEGQKSHLFLTLIVNFVTLILVAIGAAAFFRKHN